MATALTYPDAYLARFCIEEREARAFEHVDTIGTFATQWRDLLARLQCYVLACLEHQADPEDLFSSKLKSYRAEFARQLAMAQAATPDAAGSAFIMSVPLERG